MQKLKTNQDGVSSIIIVTVIISVTMLIVLGFAEVVRREQRQALDEQLTAQAKYAAESVINEKIAAYRSDPNALNTSEECDTQTPTFDTGGSDILTTCVQVYNAPGPIHYDEVETAGSTIVWLDTGDTPLDRLVVTWENANGDAGDTCSTRDYASLPPSLSGDEIGMLRFDLTNVGTEGTGFSRTSLRNDAFGGLLRPKIPGNETHAYSPGPGSQPVVFGTCDEDPDTPAGVLDAYAAHAIIDIPDTHHSNRFVLRLRSVYRPTTVRIVGFDTADEEVTFLDSQIAVEATARVGDVVQRLHVRLPAGNPPVELVPDHAIHIANGGLCKLLDAEPGSPPTDNCGP